jgi:ubiquinone/menaquinone biosynthesis C-methylase UbiE
MQTHLPNTSAHEAFSAQAEKFDDYSAQNTLTNYCREEVYKVAEQFLYSPSSILELNCGTGIDAFYFSAQGHTILATDGAEGMIEKLGSKLRGKDTHRSITPLLLAFENIDQLHPQKFDFIYSNFGGLNCTPDLKNVLNALPGLLTDKGKALLVIMPRFCWWEILHAIKGNFKLAFRRFKKNGTDAYVENKVFKTHYYSPGYIQEALLGKMKVVHLQGLCTIVPPEYMFEKIVRFPKLFKFFKKLENKWSKSFLFRSTGDYFILVLEKL